MSTQPASRPARLLTLTGHAEQVLREMICSGELAAGTRICADDAARRLGMSAIPVRASATSGCPLRCRSGAAGRVAEHRAIADACRTGAAAALVHAHLARTEQLVTAELEEHR